jgi:hypothetical protein
MTTEPFTDIDELDDMIRALAKEHRVPYPIFPALVKNERQPCPVGHEENHRQALEWRRKLIAELEERPEWVAAWRAEQDLNRRIEALCKQKGLQFYPHETPPWWAPDELPDGWRSNGTAGDESLPQAVKLRRRLIRELEAGD